MNRSILRSLMRFLFKLLTHVEVAGLDNLPKEGGVIVAVNHLSRLDPPLVYILIDRPKVTALVADKYQSKPFFRWIINSVHGIWINREEADIRALRAAQDYLKNGGILGIAPEGTRSDTGGLISAKTGVAYLAEKAGVPIIPVAVYGTEDAMHDLLTLHRPRIFVQFGKPIFLPSFDRRERSAALRKYTDEIMISIAAMLPPLYRGEYKNHPRLQEFLAETGRESLHAEQFQAPW